MCSKISATKFKAITNEVNGQKSTIYSAQRKLIFLQLQLQQQ